MRTRLPSTEAPTLPEAPFRGIEAFRYVDRGIFFARGVEVEEVLRHVALYRAVSLYGESGAGKSSLVNAGLVPAAEAHGFAPERIRLQPHHGQEVVVERIATGRGGRHAFLPSAFAKRIGAEPQIILPVEELARVARKVPRSPRLLLIFDQFEELVTLFEEAPQALEGDRPEPARRRIMATLTELIRDETVAVKMLFSFREDYLAKILKLFELLPELRDNYVRLTAPPVESLYKIIRGPFEEYPRHFSGEISSGLTEHLVGALDSLSGAEPINLSEVQIVCLRLWRSDDPERLFREKGIKGLLEGYLSETLEAFDPELQYPAVALLSRMITASGSRNVISEEDLIERVSKSENLSKDTLRDALEALGDARLVHRERRHRSYFYEIVSEFLVPWIMRQKEERLARQQVAEMMDKFAMQEFSYYWSAFRMFQLSRWLSIGIFGLVIAGGLAYFLIDRRPDPWVLALLISVTLGVIGGLRGVFGQRAARYRQAADEAAAQRRLIASFEADAAGLTATQWSTLRRELDEVAESSRSAAKASL